MTVRRRTLIAGSVVLLSFGVLVVAFPFFSNPDSLIGLVLEQVQDQLGRRIEVGEARLSFFPRLRLVLTDVVVRELDPSKVFFKAKRFELILRSTPLLRMRVMVKRLAIEQPRIELRRNRAGHWNFLAVAGTGLAGSPGGGNPLGLLLLVQQATLANGEVTITDEFRPDGVRSARLKTVDAMLWPGTKEALADLYVSATVPASLGVSSLSLTGKIMHADSPVKIGRDDPLAVGPTLQFDGMAEALNVDLRHVADFFGPRPPSERISGAANLRGHVRLVPGVAGYDMLLSDVQAYVGRLAIKGQASLSGLMTAQPTFSLTFSSSPVDLKELIDLVPVQWVHPRLHAVMAERDVRAMVEVVSAMVTGTTAPSPRVSMTGEFHVNDGHALIGKNMTPAENLSGTVIVEPDRVRVTRITGMYGPMRVSGGKATLSFPEPGPWLELEVAGDMAASDLVTLLTGVVRSERLSSSLTALRDIEGEALLTFRLAGSLNEPDGVRFVGGEFSPRGVSFNSPTVPERIVGLKGRVVISARGVELDRVAGRLGKSQFELHGTILSSGTLAFEAFTVRAKLDAVQVIRLLPSAVLADDALDGTVEAVVALAGPADAPQFRTQVELRGAGVRIPGVLQKPAGAPASLEFEGAYSQGALFLVDRYELKLPPVRLAGKGIVRTDAKFGLEASLVSGPIDLAALPAGISLGGIKAGTLEVSLDVKGRSRDWKKWQIGGWVAITDGQLALKGIADPLTNLYLRLKLVPNGAELKRLAFKIKQSDLALSGVIKDWTRTPRLTLKMESTDLDLDLLIPKVERSPVRDLLETLAATSRLVATVGVKRGVYRVLTVTDLSCRVNIRNGVLDVDRLVAQSDGGRIAGRLVVRLPRHKPAETEVSVRITGMPFEKLTRLTGEGKRLVSGLLSVTGTMRGHGRHPRGVLHTLNGEVTVGVVDGRVHKGTIVPKILGILNLPNLLQGKIDLTGDGLPFDKITGTFSVMNGRVMSEDIVVNSPVLKMTGAGSYDVPSDQLDGVMAVSPLGSYSEFLKSIPLFGRLFAGERKGIDTALFSVKGPLQDPAVEYMPLQSFATGLSGLAQLAFDVLKNTIMLPKDLVAPDEEASSPPSQDRKSNQAAPPSAAQAAPASP